MQARSIAEARLYMDLEPCPGCGHRGFSEPSKLVERGEQLAVSVAGSCSRCGVSRAFELVLAEERVPPGAWGGDDPSTLIDAGQWLSFAEQQAATVPASITAVGDGLAREDREQALARLDLAIAATGEVLKFMPPGAEATPSAAFFTASGREKYLAEPGRFSRIRIEAARAAWRTLAMELVS